MQDFKLSLTVNHFSFYFYWFCSISAFASVIGNPVRITSSLVGLKICVITVRIKKYKSIIVKKRKKHDQIVFLAKVKLNKIEVLISKTLSD